jgi:hypothetical protein
MNAVLPGLMLAALVGLIGLVTLVCITILIIHFDRREEAKRQ